MAKLKAAPQLQQFLLQPQATTLFAKVQQWWCQTLECLDEPAKTANDWPSLLLQMCDMTEQLLGYLNYTVLPHRPYIDVPKNAAYSNEWSTVALSVPHCSPEVVNRAWSVVVMVVELHLREKGSAPAESWLMKVLTPLREPMKKGTHQFFAAAAYELDIPFFLLQSDLTQFGQGHKSQWLNHTFTERTSVIPVRIARQKWQANLMLRRAGLPVPAIAPANDLKTAQEAAKRLGYPVVVKPADLDGGVGVAANLQNETQLNEAFKKSQKYSQNVLVEKHIQGRDYRIHVHDGHVDFAIERVPAGVFGDNKHTIAELTTLENRHERRREGPNKNLATLILDEEALQLLKAQGLTPQSVPAQDQFVYFRRVANISAGGRPIEALDKMHEDNKQLAIRAAQALRLDNAGIDLIIPDISVSWKESTAAICEINANPELGNTSGLLMYRNVLRNRLQGNGRIPIYVVIDETDSSSPSTLLQETVQELRKSQDGVGWGDADGVGIDKQILLSKGLSANATYEMLVIHQNVKAIVLRLNDKKVLNDGLPFERIDHLLTATEADQGSSLYQLAADYVPRA
ncbi:hypothetical protein ACFOD1_02750 [Pseudidiomarina halophila]|nr:hypothetical protein [Pseudidiomarina halophila]